MKKVEVKVDETVMDKICKAVEFATLPVFIVLCVLSFGFALTLAGFAGFVCIWLQTAEIIYETQQGH